MKTLRGPIDAELITQLRKLQGGLPLHKFAKLLGVSMQTVGFAFAGMNLQPGTRIQLRVRVDELTASNFAPVAECAA
jgi:hypothetical protein